MTGFGAAKNHIGRFCKSIAIKRLSRKKLWVTSSILLFACVGTYMLYLSHAATGDWMSGASNYAGNQDFGTWRGEPVTIVGTWCDIPDCTDGSSASEYDFFNGAMDIAIGGIFKGNGESWSAAANGAYNARWQNAINNIASHRSGKGTTFVRFAHEFNMDFQHWSVMPGEEANYKTTYCAVANMAHAAGLKMTWSANDGTLGGAATPKNTYPGDSCVDVVGPDTYDWGTDHNATMSDGSPIGIEAWRQFAASHGKPMAFPEWGLNNGSNAYDDNPAYISTMNQFMTAHAGTGAGQFLYDVYFNFIGTESNYTIGMHPTATPNAAARYQSLTWGSGNGGGSGTGTGTGTGSGGTGTGSGGGSTTGDVSPTGNLLAGKVFSSSVADSTSESGHPVSYVTDGNGSTRWISQPNSPVSLTADLGGNYALNKVSIKWAGDTIRNFQLQISSNNSTWTTFYSGATNNTSPQYVDYTSYSGTTTGRYFRIVGTDRWNSSYGNSIWEAGVYGNAVAATDTTAPTVTLTSPAAGAAVSSVVAVNGVATDNVGVTKVELLVDGAVKATNSSSSANFAWNSTSVGDGNHSIAIRATDAAGNSTATGARTITVRNTTPVPAPTISSFTASPASLTAGGSTTLSWASSNASGCSVTPGGPTNTTTTSWQTATLTTTGTRTYTLTCTNAAGSATRTVSVTVTAPVAPPAKPTFTSSATTITTGGSVTVSWSSTGATSCTLNPGNMTVAASASKLFMNLTATTTYTLSCKNSAGSTSADPLTIKVTSAPVLPADPIIVSFTATPASLTSGQTTIVSWLTSNVAANGCSLNPSPLVTTGAIGNWKTPALSSSTSYTLTCVNSAGKQTSKSISVMVNGQPAPPAPAATAPPVNKADATAKTVTASTGQSVSNAAATETVAGPTTLDPSNVTNSAKEQSILRVEYYNGETLIQTDDTKPFVLDTTRLKNGRYTLTERTYFIDGSQSEVTRVVTVANNTIASKKSKPWLWLLLLLPMIGGGFWFVKRKLSSDDISYDNYSSGDYLPYTPAPMATAPMPSLQTDPHTASDQMPVFPGVPNSLPLSTPEHAAIPDWQQPIIAQEMQQQASSGDLVGDPFLEADKQFQHAASPSKNSYPDSSNSTSAVDTVVAPAPLSEASDSEQSTKPSAKKPTKSSGSKTVTTKQSVLDDDGSDGVILIDHHKK